MGRRPLSPAAGLRGRYLLALSFIALLSLASQAVIQLALAGNDDAGRVVNIAGRQRMLDQRIAKDALGILETGDPAARAGWAAELSSSLELWERSHDALLFGSEELGVKGKNSPVVLGLFGRLEPTYGLLRHAARDLAQAAGDPSVDQGRLSALAAPILQLEGPFLEGMNAIVYQYDRETGERVAFARALEAFLLLVMLLALALEALFIFRPGERKINDYVRELDRALQDNRSLLRELQHRVKNTLVMVTGILSLSQEGSRSEEARSVLEAALARTRSLSDLYSLLYTSGRASEVLAADYLSRILSSFRGLNPAIVFEAELPSLGLPPAVAAPLGIIVSELLTNALKYAFPGGRPGRIRLGLAREGEGCLLELLDDGVGPPPCLAEGGGSGTGLMLVSELAEQIGGSFSLEAAHPGTRCLLRFSLPPEAEAPRG